MLCDWKQTGFLFILLANKFALQCCAELMIHSITIFFSFAYIVLKRIYYSCEIIGLFGYKLINFQKSYLYPKG